MTALGLNRAFLQWLLLAALIPGSIGVVSAQIPGAPVELWAARLMSVPEANWGEDFPAVSSDLQRVAVIERREADHRDVVLRLLRLPSLTVEWELPLDYRPGGNVAACEQSDDCIEALFAEAIDLLKAGDFKTLWPLYRENLRYQRPELDLISFYHFRVRYDQDRNELEIRRAIGLDIENALLELDYQDGEVYLWRRWPRESWTTDQDGQPCSGKPVPYAAWVNPDWGYNGLKLILVGIDHVAAGGCHFAAEWFAQLIE